jgi:hypothetical protein
MFDSHSLAVTFIITAKIQNEVGQDKIDTPEGGVT